MGERSEYRSVGGCKPEPGGRERQQSQGIVQMYVLGVLAMRVMQMTLNSVSY